jgi:hypothetical protein
MIESDRDRNGYNDAMMSTTTMPTKQGSSISSPRPKVSVKKTTKAPSLLGRLRVVKVSPDKGKKTDKDMSNAPLPNEVVVMDNESSPSSCTDNEEIEESLETMKIILRKPCRFTFDVVPSVSESFEEEPMTMTLTENKGWPCDLVKSTVSGLSILDDSQIIKSPAVANNYFQTTSVESMGPTKLDRRTRTNSTSATSAFSSSDVFCGSTGHIDVVKMTTSANSFTDHQSTNAADFVVQRPNATESSWFNFFSLFMGNSSASCAV